ncbi:hypothetical protein JCM10207_001646 [Rhodosporidiobolus poonsookiae]
MLPPLRNPYTSPTDFNDLAKDVPAFAPFLRSTGGGRASIDWQDDAAVRGLTSALLKRDFDLEIDLPPDRLCPTVPSRLEYVLFVLRLALLTADTPSTSSTAPQLVGLDIGTGASCIYPLLACRTLPPTSSSSSSCSPPSPLRMLATDIDPHSLSYAKRNVACNDLQERIRLFEVEQEGKVFPDEVVGGEERIDFTMCNPPFYASEEEIASSLAAKELEPFAVCTGAPNEMLTTGGEVAFVSRMIVESLSLPHIRWFTSLFGKYSSLSPLVALLKHHGIGNYAVTALPPQGQTTRWVVVWSKGGRRFPPELLYPSSFAPSPSPSSSASLTRLLPPSLLPSTFHLPHPCTLSTARAALEGVLSELVPLGKEGALEWSWDEVAAEEAEQDGDGVAVRVRARRNVWSRAARRAAAAAATVESPAAGASASARQAAPPPLLLELRIQLLPSFPPPPPASASPAPHPANEPGPVRLVSTWLSGSPAEPDAGRAAYTGLWGFVVRKVGERVRVADGKGATGTEGEGEAQEETEEEGERAGKRRRVEVGGEEA